ncbi:hypothetical protein [Roseburia inulinivorans]|uniref:hypothetical protein n=1 Tax=Roseburia inulinivorans TaxID=360807 RepID=UPI00266D4D0A|nr:hypothetical protein [Roseburia inulinivorans]
MAKCKRNRNRAKRNLKIKTPTANRNYKDTVFRMLFSDRKNLLSLYNAVNQSNYSNPDDLEIVTLENAIYMGMKNDLAFIMDTNLYLYEHQSTYNPNMPLRDLFYICSEYQKLVDKKSLYSSTLQKIPAPNFIEFYNGSTTVPDCTELRLSSAFEHLSGEPKLELLVTVLNVNEGHNADLMQHCNTLNEYAQYVARVRHYASDMSLNHAVECAVDECIREGILAEFLTRNRNEVISMSIFEYDKELEEKKLRKAEYEAGFSEGEKHGHEAGFSEGEKHGHETGFSEGEKYGIERGTFLNSIETARRMLQFQEFSLEKIAAITGLPFDEVKKLQANEARSGS